jgi:hypothetical protein
VSCRIRTVGFPTINSNPFQSFDGWQSRQKRQPIMRLRYALYVLKSKGIELTAHIPASLFCPALASTMKGAEPVSSRNQHPSLKDGWAAPLKKEKDASIWPF